METFLHPSFVFLLAAALAAVLPKGPRKIAMLVLPLAAFAMIEALALRTPDQPASPWTLQWLGFTLVPVYVDRLTVAFLHVFTLMAFIGAVYGLHVEDRWQHVAAALYVAGSLGVTLAGDYLTLFVFWELMAVASTFLVWLRRRPESTAAGYRYLLVHVAGGLILMAGIFLRYGATGSLAVGRILPEHADLAAYLILIGFALNAAVPPIHAWLPDAYPESTVMGGAFMCAFTTKTAVYALARVFPGYEVLMIGGAIMTLYGVGYAIIENSGRKILSYHIVSQVGYMVCGVGVGTAMAINGAVAHAYAHILYKALLFMGVGSVVEMVGHDRLSDLGGLYKRMPLAMLGTVIGGISISGFPFTSGFISKSMIVAGAGGAGHLVIMLMLLLASVGTFLSVGIKLPYFIWFGEDSGVPAKDPPWNMVAGMGLAAFFCFFLGLYPHYLYRLLPFTDTVYHPYTAYHFSETIQLLGFTGLGFYVLRKKLSPEAKTNLDVDWFYRKGAVHFLRFARGPVSSINDWVGEAYRTVGMAFALATAKFWSAFDVIAIDGAVDGLAYGVRHVGDKVRHTQTGKLQQYVAVAVLAFFGVLALVISY
ncbi:MAG: Na(+)/H(+) antiporter subunit D [Deltaproteobacteria bacterium]|nr:Na(+)/H(+) antiporter subunit D [Deltaproteobacteria bacterium]